MCLREPQAPGDESIRDRASRASATEEREPAFESLRHRGNDHREPAFENLRHRETTLRERQGPENDPNVKNEWQCF